MNTKVTILMPIFLFIILFSLLARTFSYELIWDDRIYLNENSYFFNSYSIFDSFKVGFFKKAGDFKASYYRPLVVASFLVESKLWGLHNWSMRSINFIIYFLSLIIFYLFLKSWIKEEYLAEMIIVLFALNPLNVDNILWCVGRCDLFLLLWFGLSLLFLENSIRNKEKKYLFYSSLFFFLGLLSKESIVFLFPVLIIYEIIRCCRVTWFYHVSNAILIGLYFLVRINMAGIPSLKMVFYSKLLSNIKILFLACGYYFKATILPYRIPMFLSNNMLFSFKYLLFGSLFVLFILSVSFLSVRRREILFPLALIVTVIGGHILLVFSLVYPYKIYSRYMMIPTLGIIMLFVFFLKYCKSKWRLIISGILAISFIPFFLVNSYAYKNEWVYFQKAKEFMPEDDFVNYQLAKVKWDQHDFISAEIILNQMLYRPLRKKTAMLLSLIYADIEFIRANYDKCLKWVESIREFEKPYLDAFPFGKFQIKHKKAMIALVRGNFDEAERIFRENIEKFYEIEDSYKELYLMLLGLERWNEAESLEEKIIKNFGRKINISTKELKMKFITMSEEDKIEFYILHRNYPKAVDLLEKKKELNLQERFQLAKLYFRMGLESKGNEIIKGIYEENKDNYEVLNMVGSFFIIDFIRIPQGLAFLEQSLRLNPEQTNIQILVLRLRHEYLEKIRDPWAGR